MITKTFNLKLKNMNQKLHYLALKDGLKFYKLFAKNIEKLMKKNSFFYM